MDSNWMNDPAMKQIDPAKLELIRMAAEQTAGKSGRDLVPVMLALISGIVYTLLGFSQAMGFVQQVGDISFSLLAGGLRVTCIPVIYGMLIYMLSLVIRLVQKPRI